MQPEQPSEINGTTNPEQPPMPAPDAPQPEQAVPIQKVDMPQPPVAPPISSEPVPAGPVVSSFAPAPVPAAPVAQKPKSHLGLILGIIGGAVVLIVGVFIALYVFVISPSLLSVALATGFMTNMTSNRVDAALVQAGNNADEKTFLQESAIKLQGNSFKLQSSVYNASGASNYLFALTGGDEKYARVTVEKQNGKRTVTGFVYSASALKLESSTSKSATTNTTSAASTQTSQTSASSTTATTAATGCLNANSFTDLNPYPTDASYDGRYVWYDDFFFKPDSAEYNYPDIMTETFAKYKTFYQNNASKQFTITLSGTVYSASPATDLANARAAKVKVDLTSQAGIPSDRITIGDPQNSENQDNEAARNVDIVIQSPESCATVKS